MRRSPIGRPEVIEYLFEEGVEMGDRSKFCAVGSPNGGGPFQGFACESRSNKIHPALVGGEVSGVVLNVFAALHQKSLTFPR